LKVQIAGIFPEGWPVVSVQKFSKKTNIPEGGIKVYFSGLEARLHLATSPVEKNTE